MMAHGIRRFRIELVDEPADVVEPLLSGYRAVASAQEKHSVQDLMTWLGEIPDGNGRSQGVTLGALLPTVELSRNKLKPTAYQKQ